MYKNYRATNVLTFNTPVAFLNITIFPSDFTISSVTPGAVRGLTTGIPASIAGIFQFRKVVGCPVVSMRTLGRPWLTRETRKCFGYITSVWLAITMVTRTCRTELCKSNKKRNQMCSPYLWLVSKWNGSKSWREENNFCKFPCWLLLSFW